MALGIQGLALPEGIQGLALPEGIQGLALPEGIQGLALPEGIQGLALPEGIQGLALPEGIQGLALPEGIQGLALPEINADSAEEYDRSWKRLELIAVANKWENGKDLVVLPALLRGKLLDAYTSLSDAEEVDLNTLKRSLAERAGLVKDPLVSAKKFRERRQEHRESVRDFELSLRKLFAEAYLNEDVNSSSVFLSRFITGLRSDIARQVLLYGTPTKIEDTVRNAIRIEMAQGFDESQQQVQAVTAGGHG